MGAPLPADFFTDPAAIARTGNVTLRVLANQPNMANLYRLDQLVAAMASRPLWLTDAYFVGLPAYVQALRAAAQDGVDVRLLVPGSSNLFAVASMSRAGYRALLEGGVRVFEWNGPMLHAKTAVADARWARVGSTSSTLDASAACTTLPAFFVDSTSAASDSSPVHSVSPTLNVRRSRSAN